MLNERRARRLDYDPGTDVARLAVEGSGPSTSTRAETVEGSLLVDAGGALVGVDIGEGPKRTVVMLGKHEAVAKMVPARVDVARGAGGEISEIRIPSARGAIRV
jgi:hypothetical protein